MISARPKQIIHRPRAQVERSRSTISLVTQVEAITRCAYSEGLGGFLYFCRNYVYVRDKDTNTVHLAEPWPGQLRVFADWITGVWSIGLKGRQGGFTTGATWFVMWLMRFWPADWLGMVVAQEKPYALEFKSRVVEIHDRLPEWMRGTIVSENDKSLKFRRDGQVAELRVFAGGDKAGRMFTGDLAVFDEASRIDEFTATLTAVIPTLKGSIHRERAGQIIVLSTSRGPTGDFFELWNQTYGEGGDKLDQRGVGPTSFKPVFIHWSERPGRESEEWYNEQVEELSRLHGSHRTGLIKARQEYPSTIEEAWEFAAGRVYPLFTRQTHVGRIKVPKGAIRYRAIDWGETKSAYVVLWVAFMDGPPGFLISPDCPNMIREMLAYKLDEDPPHFPVKENDHTCDAIRYLVTTMDLRGLVYVYREVYRTDSVDKGWNPMSEIEEIHRLSGWERSPAGSRNMYRPTRSGEDIDMTVCDRSWLKAIAQLSKCDIPARGAMRMKGPKRRDDGPTTDNRDSEILEGIRHVSMLIDGTADVDHRIEITREARSLAIYRDIRKRPAGVRVPLEERALAQLAQDLLGQRRGRR